MAKKPAKKARRVPASSHFITTIPVIRPCRACGVWLAAGIAEGLHSQADLIGLDLGQQIQAIVMRIPLYCLTRTGLVEMDQSRLKAPPGVVYPGHRCDVRWQPKTGLSVLNPQPKSDTIPF